MGINKSKLLLILIFGAISLISCQNKKMEEKFNWSAIVSAPQEFPVELYSGALTADDYTSSFSSIWGTLIQVGEIQEEQWVTLTKK